MPSRYFKKGYGKMSEAAEERILKAVTIKCKECDGNMLRVTKHDYHLHFYKGLKHLEYQLGNDDTVIGYSCEDCTHHYLFD